MPRSPSTNLAGLQSVSRMVYQRMVRSSRSPWLVRGRDGPGTKLYLRPAMARQNTAFGGKRGQHRHFCALPLDSSWHVSDYVCESHVNLQLEVFHDEQNP